MIRPMSAHDAQFALAILADATPADRVATLQSVLRGKHNLSAEAVQVYRDAIEREGVRQ